ncbi:MAG TPA: hypothetical protein VMC85_00865 [Desulfomonilaceae bacterium]|nr:hypothetical protein [Desulfomonilaceae bacterium]
MKAICCLMAILSITVILVPSFSIAIDQKADVADQETQKPSTFETDLLDLFSRKSGQELSLTNIPPLYLEPKMSGEGIWVRQELSEGDNSTPLVYKTFYRPSSEYPNAIVYMMLFNMKHISPKMYLGSCEPYWKESCPHLSSADQSRLLAITNALWITKHAGRGGIILQGEILKPMEKGVATVVFYKNGAADIVEWNDEIQVSEVQDARQLLHLIVKDSQVITSMVRRGVLLSAEIGLGSLLNEEQPITMVPAAAPGEKPTSKLNFTSGDLWFLGTRSAFGIRPDGNLVFVMGHHISTADLAKALVLAGCVRGIHADANPGNCLGIVYCRDKAGQIANKVGLSPTQNKSSLDRYLKGVSTKDFFAFFKRTPEGK